MISKISLSEPAFTLLNDTLLSAYAPEIKPTEEWVANDEIKDGLSERGGHSVEQKKMMQFLQMQWQQLLIHWRQRKL